MNEVTCEEYFLLAKEFYRLESELSALQTRFDENERRISLIKCELDLISELDGPFRQSAATLPEYLPKARADKRNRDETRYRTLKKEIETGDVLPRHVGEVRWNQELFAQQIRVAIERGSLDRFDIADAISSLEFELKEVKSETRQILTQRGQRYIASACEMRQEVILCSFDLDPSRQVVARIKATRLSGADMAYAAASHHIQSLGGDSDILKAADWLLCGIALDLI